MIITHTLQHYIGVNLYKVQYMGLGNNKQYKK